MEDLCLKLCECGALKFGNFKMHSGLNSPVYFDLRVITSFPKLMEELSLMVWKHIQDFKLNCKVICGVPYTALPIATLVSVSSNLPMLVRRKEPKKHGTMKLIEGNYSEGDSCLIIEDVVTSGGSILETTSDLRKAGLIVSDAVVVIDRGQGGIKHLEQNGIKTHSIFTLSQILDILLKRKILDNETVDGIRKYIDENQIRPDGEQMASKPAIDRLSMNYEKRISTASCEVAKKLFALMNEKMTNLCVAVDVTTSAEVLKVVDQVGPYVCIIKTHYDAVTDWSEDTESALKQLAMKHNFLIMEDRKLGDIGNTIHLQCKKLFSWSDLITMHSVAGTGSLQGVQSVLQNMPEGRGIVLVAQMSSKDNLISQDYTKATCELGEAFKNIVAGFVCQDHTVFTNPGMLQFTPGVAAKEGNDSFGQQYSTPENVVSNKGADIVIIGRAVTLNSDPAKAAGEFKEILWKAYKKRAGMV